ncbi:hypothetical protein D4T97_001450 [Siminovitchia acidinfaciens]|uniref:Periplasmic binding protein domain-containing protein n=2 Tax=Siminovitchia acidinfaciens TaxID=2321395 RepID=A0A429Y6X7_9BACI|nr:hypothetical protein D4T97_001450 [Siminovitchia acidinfaciens]
MFKKWFYLTVAIMVIFVSGCGKQTTKGDQIKVGVSIALEANNTVKTWYEAIKARGESYGFDVIGIDAQGDPGKQVSDIDSLLAQGVDAVVVWPLDANALTSTIDRVRDQDIPVFGIDFNVELGGSDYGLTNQIILGRGDTAEKVAELFAENLPEGAEVAGIGYAVPVPGNTFIMKKLKSEIEKHSHLQWVGQQDNPTDNISGAEPLMSNILTKNPNLKALFTYNDESAIGAAQAVLNANKKLYSAENPEGIMIIGFNAEESGIEAIEQGKEYATFNLNPVKAGAASVDYIHQLLVEGVGLATIPAETVIPSPMVDKTTLSQFDSWEEELKLIIEGKSFDPFDESGTE